MADHEIAVVVGPEVIAGSTRLKAGTAQKLVLNTISTIAMVRLGKTFGNLMVDVVRDEREASRTRTADRPHATGADPEQVDEALAAADGDAKVAIVSLLAGVDAEAARARLAAAGGVVRKALDREARRRSRARRRPARAGRRRGRRRHVVGRRPRRRRTAAASRRPGFVDLQVNGFAGVDFLGADADGYAAAGDALLETGVTAYLPTFITSPRGRPRRRAPRGARRRRAARASSARTSRARSSRRSRLGTHRPAGRRDPDPALLERLLAAGPVRLMTLAPELPGALELVDLLHERGVTVSLGHSDATAAEAHAAFDRGVRTVTHVFNAMRPLSHRDPGIVGAALVRARRRRPGDRRRRASRPRRSCALLWRVGGRPRRARHRRDGRSGRSATAPTRSASVEIVVATASSAARTACWPGAR